MAKYFLGSVGEATAFRINGDGSKQFMFNATSLTDQGINISSSQDEIRAGTGAMVVATFNHDTSVQLTLTDVFWKREYVEAKLGQKFQNNATDYQYEQHHYLGNGAIEFDKEPVTALLPCSTQEAYIILYAKAGSDEWQELSATVNGKNVTPNEALEEGDYCFKYLSNDEQAREIFVGADMVPDELFLIIQTPLYAGDACAASNGNVCGHITFEIPRFKIDPNLDLSFAMSSNVTMAIGGSALAYVDSCNLNGSKLMRIVECINGRDQFDGLKAIYIDPEFDAKAGEIVPVYGVYKNGSAGLLNNEGKFGPSKLPALSFSISASVLKVELAEGVMGVVDQDQMPTVATHVSSNGYLYN